MRPELSSVHYPRENVKLTVRDTGCGMEAKVRERIFDPFFTTKPLGEGTGMGLAVVHGIVTSHGGTIMVTSQPGQESVFDIYFPLMAQEAVSTQGQDGPVPRGSERILFVDDEQAVVLMAQQMLEGLGYKTVVTTSGVKALDLFSTDPHHFDAVITDQTMPGMTGVELATKLLQLRPNLPIILCTGYSKTVSAEQAKEFGIRRYLMKPLSEYGLGNTLKQALADT